MRGSAIYSFGPDMLRFSLIYVPLDFDIICILDHLQTNVLVLAL